MDSTTIEFEDPDPPYRSISDGYQGQNRRFTIRKEGGMLKIDIFPPHLPVKLRRKDAAMLAGMIQHALDE